MTNTFERFRDVGGAEGLLAAYQLGERNFERANLENANLDRANLSGINLRKANLQKANLAGANLSEANLEKADCQLANFSQANLSKANLNEAKLDAANLNNANLKEALLNSAYIVYAQLSSADLQKAGLYNADLRGANLAQSILEKADLSSSSLRKANLQKANLRQAKLANADLTDANLEQSILEKTDLSYSCLIKANLQEANLRQANLSNSKVHSTNFICANLQKSDLTDIIDLEWATLVQTDLRGATLSLSKQQFARLKSALVGDIDFKLSLYLKLRAWGSSFDFSPNGEMFAYTNSDKKVTIINTHTRKQINQIDIRSEQIISAAFSANGQTIYDSLYINELKIWDSFTGEIIDNFKHHSAKFTPLLLNNKGEFIPKTTEIVAEVDSPDGQIIARKSSEFDCNIELIDRQTNKKIRILEGHTASVKFLAFSPDSHILASVSIREVKLWQVKTGEEIDDEERSYRSLSDTYQIAFTQRDNIEHPLLITSDFYVQFQYRKAKIERNGKFDWSNIVAGQDTESSGDISVSADGKVLARRYRDRPIELWNLETGQTLATVNLNGYPFALSPKGNILAIQTQQRDITLWDIKTNSLIQKLRSDKGYIYSIVFSPDDRILASGSSDRTIKLWNLETGCEIATLEDYSPIRALAFSPIEPILASGSWQGTIKLWDLKTMEEVYSFRIDREVKNLAFSPDGKYLASCNDKGNICLWKLERH